MVSSELKSAIAAELNHLTRRAEERRTESESDEDQAHETIAAIYSAALSQARAAFARGAYRPALELARAAEALAHVDTRLATGLSDGHPARRLAS
jgi:hypothetical protein